MYFLMLIVGLKISPHWFLVYAFLNGNHGIEDLSLLIFCINTS